MRIVILGAGRVGESVAESLVSERNDITLVDPDAHRLRELEERLELRGLPGNGVHPSTLERAGMGDADMLIACAAQDETNLVACKIAHDVFGVPTTVARLRSPEFEGGSKLLERGGFAVDHVICPEESVVRYIQKLIEYPEALQVLEFAKGRAQLVAVRVTRSSRYGGRPLGEFYKDFADVPVRVVAIYREDSEQPCDAGTKVQVGDEVFLLADQHSLRKVLKAVHSSDKPVRRVMIAGGGNVGLRLARRLRGVVDVKLIERFDKRCEYLATQLPVDMLVLQGDGTDEELLADENVDNMDFFLALTSDDEDNILSAMLAKRLGARRVLALINRRAYADLIQGSTIDIALSPAQTVIGELLAHVRRGDVVAVHSLRRGMAEALEGVAHGDAKTSRLVGRTVPEIDALLPDGVRLGAVVRGEGDAQRVLMPSPETRIESDDHLIIFIPKKKLVREVERLFQVSATFF
ncbi:Trk system potassium transporter TrkA [Ramlibacter henchirensis]|uniref:Trk system potassium uptake protein TrkA n=1 Tax=Ramlibacter henchirensis TaxID=204072 RepID=A0A4Z0C9P4_9BURK|nr:Trk system potassium transporter TrkA [Ramlibacter henchirensis]TFZ07128.1 Trk system potassium transporter TrkA [Ramlibacter henchirensis]